MIGHHDAANEYTSLEDAIDAVDYVKSEDLAGVMTWDINRDCDQRMNYPAGQVFFSYFWKIRTKIEHARTNFECALMLLCILGQSIPNWLTPGHIHQFIESRIEFRHCEINVIYPAFLVYSHLNSWKANFFFEYDDALRLTLFAFQTCFPLAWKWTRCWIELQIRWQILDLSGSILQQQQSLRGWMTKAMTQELDTTQTYTYHNYRKGNGCNTSNIFTHINSRLQ